VRCIVPETIACPRCAARSTAIRAWRAFAQIFYVGETCEAAWTVAIDLPETRGHGFSKFRNVLC
jgi:hypothetical protein